MLPPQRRRGALPRRLALLLLLAACLAVGGHYRRRLGAALTRRNPNSDPDADPDSDLAPLPPPAPPPIRSNTSRPRPAPHVRLRRVPEPKVAPKPPEPPAAAEPPRRRSLEEAVRAPRPSQYRDLLDRIERTVPKEVWGGPAPASLVSLAQRTGCDVLTVPFDPKKDAACQRYLGNRENWAEVVAMAALFDERTVKFKVRLKEEGLWAILKVPQRMFSQEPYSEYVAWVVDRALHYNRIPPIVWVDGIPLSLLTEALARHPDQKHVAFVQDEFLDFVRKAHYVKRDAHGHETIGVSLQMWTLDVHHLLDTEYLIPYRAHNGSWHRYFDPANGYPESLSIPVHHLSQILTFDYIISNNDRSPNKNNYVAGGCKHRRCQRKRKKPWHPGPPDFIYLDHGMGFYHTGPPHDSPLAKPDSPFCLFRRPVIARLLELESKGTAQPLTQLIMPSIPAAVQHRLSAPVLAACQSRLDRLLGQARRCMTRWDEEVVLVP